MAFRRAAADRGSPIDRFWQWWTTRGSAEMAQALADRRAASGALPGKMAELLDSIDSRLEWETGPGVVARHALCVTAAGDPAVRPTAERWWRAAPPADALWEYLPARRADPDAIRQKLQYDDWDVDLGQTRFGLQIDDDRQRVAIRCFHPAFPAMPDKAQRAVTYLILDWLLGEDDVERWLGSVEPHTLRPDDSLPIEALGETVAQLASRNAETTWTIMEGQPIEGMRHMAVARRPLRWIDFPLYDNHVTVTVEYRDKREDGLPTPESLDVLQAVQEEVTSAVAGHGEFVAHQTCNGRRLLHFYADSEDPEVARLLDQSVRRHPAAWVSISPDPGWSDMRPFR